MTVSIQDLDAWFRERPKWLQDAAYRIIQNGNLLERDYQELMTICISEVLREDVAFRSLPANALNKQDSEIDLRLESVGDIQGINALCPSKPLEFGKEQLCIVYGRNGAGKSGYVRLLKHACGAKRPGTLLTNIFVAEDQQQAARIVFTKNAEGKEQTTHALQWLGSPLTELRGVDIYDTACGLVYVNEENEVVFEPWILRLFTELTNTCEIISKRIQGKIAAMESKKPIFPKEMSLTTAASWYSSLTAGTTLQDIEDKTAWTSDDESALTDMNKRLFEVNPTEKALSLRRQKGFTLELTGDLKKTYQSLSHERCMTHLAAKKDADLKRKVAGEDAQRAFSKAPLPGIGTDSWQLLWDAARRYSEDQAYRSALFPNVSADSRCVLCQQVLDRDACDRFISFESFVKGDLRRLAANADETLQSMTDSLGQPVDESTLAVKIEAAGIGGHVGALAISDFMRALAKRREECLAAEEITQVSELPPNSLLINLVQFARNLSKQARSYDKDAAAQNRPQLEQQVKEFAARKWLSQQRTAIEDEIKRLSRVRILELVPNCIS